MTNYKHFLIYLPYHYSNGPMAWNHHNIDHAYHCVSGKSIIETVSRTPMYHIIYKNVKEDTHPIVPGLISHVMF